MTTKVLTLYHYNIAYIIAQNWWLVKCIRKRADI